MLDPLLLAYQNQLDLIRSRARLLAAGIWQTLGSYDENDVEQFLERFLPALEASQSLVAHAAESYLAARLGNPQMRLDLAGVTGDQIRAAFGGGAAPTTDELYLRPFLRTWHDLALGEPMSVALDAGQQVLTKALDTDLTASSWTATQQLGGQVDKVIGYVRVPGGSNVCGFCVSAASQFYKNISTEELHDNCQCTVEPITSHGRSDQLRQPYLNAYRQHIKPALADAKDALGRPRGDAGHTRDTSRMSHVTFTRAADGSLTPA